MDLETLESYFVQAARGGVARGTPGIYLGCSRYPSVVMLELFVIRFWVVVGPRVWWGEQ